MCKNFGILHKWVISNDKLCLATYTSVSSYLVFLPVLWLTLLHGKARELLVSLPAPELKDVEQQRDLTVMIPIRALII